MSCYKMFYLRHCNHNVHPSKKTKGKRKETKYINAKKKSSYTMKVRAKDVTTA